MQSWQLHQFYQCAFVYVMGYMQNNPVICVSDSLWKNEHLLVDKTVQGWIIIINSTIPFLKITIRDVFNMSVHWLDTGFSKMINCTYLSLILS